MRTTIACQWCRRSKVKCHHSGVAPCRSCKSASRDGCVLSAPIVKGRKRQRTSYHPDDSNQARASTLRDDSDLGTSRGDQSTATASTTPRPEPGLHEPYSLWRREAVDLSDTDLPPPTLVDQACNIFSKIFPEFGFLHRPTFFDQLRTNNVDKVKLHAILSMTARFIPELVSKYGGPETAGDFYAAKVRSCIMERAVEKPDPDTVQCLLLVGMHEWGSCNSFRAWMFTGMAIRMAQALQFIGGEETAPNQLYAGGSMSFETAQECVRRTIWATFVVDCLLSGGKQRPQSFQAARLDLSLPLGEEDFAFQTEPDEPPSHLLRLALSASVTSSGAQRLQDCDNSLSIIINGLDIWSTLSSWICAGGRRLEPNSPSSSPWNPDSFWKRIQKALHRWRASMSPRLYYSCKDNNLQAHISRGQGEQFVFINLTYHLNAIFLHREYIPFLAHRCSQPNGPIDPPLLPPAPDGWWRDNSRDLFDSATNVIDLVRAAQRRGLELRTVFVSFCVYSATVSLLYAKAWPHMAPDAENVQEDYTWGFQWLEDASKLWKMVQGWKDTLDTMTVVYNRINADSARFIQLGRAELEELEDHINRFAEIATPASGPNTTTPSGEHAAETLLTLAQHGRPVTDEDAPRTAVSRQNTDLQQQQQPLTTVASEEYDSDMIGGGPTMLASQDLLESIMYGSMADWSQFHLEDFQRTLTGIS